MYTLLSLHGSQAHTANTFISQTTPSASFLHGLVLCCSPGWPQKPLFFPPLLATKVSHTQLGGGSLLPFCSFLSSTGMAVRHYLGRDKYHGPTATFGSAPSCRELSFLEGYKNCPYQVA